MKKLILITSCLFGMGTVSNAQSTSNQTPISLSTDLSTSTNNQTTNSVESSSIETVNSSTSQKPAKKTFKERTLGGKILIILACVIIGSGLMYLGVNVTAG